MFRALVVSIIILLVPVSGSNAAIFKEPSEHHCYAMTDVLGAKPIEVPCSPQPPTPEPAPVPPTEEVEPVAPTPPPVCYHHRRHKHHRHHH